MKSQAKKCDKLFADKVKSRGRCQKCSKKEFLQCAHIISRRYKQVRWNLNNAMCLCRGCHLYFTHHPLEWENFVVKVVGLKTYVSIKKTALKYGKIDYEEVLERLI